MELSDWVTHSSIVSDISDRAIYVGRREFARRLVAAVRGSSGEGWAVHPSGQGSSPTHTPAVPPTAPSHTRPGTGHWPASAPTSRSTPPGRTTPRHSSACNEANPTQTSQRTLRSDIRGCQRSRRRVPFEVSAAVALFRVPQCGQSYFWRRLRLSSERYLSAAQIGSYPRTS